MINKSLFTGLLIIMLVITVLIFLTVFQLESIRVAVIANQEQIIHNQQIIINDDNKTFNDDNKTFKLLDLLLSKK